ncbi:MAG: DUF357 domain-containing protein [Candidatus Woesearchaeota archaeon]
MREITDKHLAKYVEITVKALEMAKENFDKPGAEIVWDMADRYYRDAMHFKDKGDIVNSFACINYAHGWLDCGARLGFFKVRDSTLFTVD